MLTLKERFKKIRKKLKKYHRPVERISWAWLKIGELAMVRSPYKPHNENEWVLDPGIGFWKEFPPPDMDGNHFGLRADIDDDCLYEQICLIADKRIYKYFLPQLGTETLIQIVVNEKIIWVRANDLKKCIKKK